MVPEAATSKSLTEKIRAVIGARARTQGDGDHQRDSHWNREGESHGQYPVRAHLFGYIGLPMANDHEF